MKKGLFILLIFCFSLTVISCSDDKEEYSATGTTDNTTTTDDTTTSSGLYVAVGNSATVLKSSDGTTWTTVSATYEHPDNGTISLSDHVKGVTYGNSTFVAVGTYDNGSTSIITSTDATAWTYRTSGTTNTLNGVTYRE